MNNFIAECAVRLENFNSSNLTCNCPTLFEKNFLNEAKYNIHEKPSISRFEEK